MKPLDFVRSLLSKSEDKRGPFFQSAVIYGFKGQVLVHPYARTRGGVGIEMTDIAVASVTDTREIGEKLLAMLERCVDNIPDNYHRKPIPALAVTLKAAKMRSWRSFHKEAMLVSAYRKIGSAQIKLTPNRHVRHSSEVITEKAVLSGNAPEELGANVIRVLALCE